MTQHNRQIPEIILLQPRAIYLKSINYIGAKIIQSKLQKDINEPISNYNLIF